uniref:Ig-like domain-containing protein n=1 Tax=Astyanax mexicanus TaxID=7994 RepID=A0A8B9RBI0_ASTMX
PYLDWISLTLGGGEVNPSNALKKMEVNLGQSQMLKCDMSYHHEINWIRMDDQAKPKTLMVMGLKNDGAMSVAWNFNDSHFEGCVVDRFIGLRIYQVSESDLATYFCAASHNKRMEFGEGIHRDIFIIYCSCIFLPIELQPDTFFWVQQFITQSVNLG